MEKISKLELLIKQNSYLVPGDEELEVDDFDGKLYISKYSEKRGSAEAIKRIGKTDNYNVRELIKMCDRNHWYYCV